MKTLVMGESDSLPVVLRHLLKLRHGQIIFKGVWNGTVGEQSDLKAVIHVHVTLLSWCALGDVLYKAHTVEVK